MKSLTIILVLLLGTFSIVDAQVADAVYTNGKIYTVNDEQPWVEAVAIKDGKFLLVGAAADVKAVTGDDTRVIDLDGKLVLPGLHDQHVHIEQAYKGEILGEQLLTFPGGIATVEEAAKLLKDFAAQNPDAKVLFGQSLEYGIFDKITNEWMDEAVPDRPVVILSSTEHEGILNSSEVALVGTHRRKFAHS